jgi:hypothetical protein
MHVGPQFILVAMTLELCSGARGGMPSITSKPASSAGIRESGVFSCACASPVSWKSEAQGLQLGTRFLPPAHHGAD